MSGGDWITATVRQHVETHQPQLPLFDQTGTRLHALLQEPEFDVSAAERLIESDPTLATALLRAANSPVYRGLEKTVSIHDAVVRLGAQDVANLALLMTHSQSYRLGDPALRHHLGVLWRHAVASAVSAQWLAGKLGRPDLKSRAFLGGLLHDVGKLFVLRVLDDVEDPRRDALVAAAPELMASLHAEEGFGLLRRWHIPDVVCEVVRHHHDDLIDDGDPLALIVRLADHAANSAGIGLGAALDAEQLAACEEARTLGVPEKGVSALLKCVHQAVEMV